jgi:hypothetical protein
MSVAFGEGGQLDGMIDDKRRLDQTRLDDFAE